MRTIHKQIEPPCLADVRREARREEKTTGCPPVPDDWTEIRDCASAVRDYLCLEQLGLCAYCMSRIKPHGYRAELPKEGGMKIEHFIARSVDPRRMFDWDNLLGVCGGRYKWSGEDIETCDEARKNHPLHIHPAGRNPDPSTVFRTIIGRDRRTLGQLQSTTVAGDSDIRTLNLNADPLVHNRADEVMKLRRILSEDDSDENLRKLHRVASTPTQQGLPAYAPVAIQYLERKMRKRGIEP